MLVGKKTLVTKKDSWVLTAEGMVVWAMLATNRCGVGELLPRERCHLAMNWAHGEWVSLVNCRQQTHGQ